MDGQELGAGTDIREVVRSRSISMVFQPVFDLTTDEVVGFEALARGPRNSPLESPYALFEQAHAHGLTAELDWVCRAAAAKAFLDADAPPALTLLVNADPLSFGEPCPSDLLPVIHRAEETLRVMVEVNDRALAHDPAELMLAEERARSLGWGLALDDVGSGADAVGMLPVVRPDVVKVDLALLRKVSDVDAAGVVLSAMRHVERTRAALCVESIETADDVRRARALGAVYGQGRYLGEPVALPPTLSAPRRPIPLVTPPLGDRFSRTPWDLLDSDDFRRMDRTQFVELAHMIANATTAPGAAPVFLAGLGARPLDREQAAEFPHQDATLLAAAFGVGLEQAPLPRLRGVGLQRDDPLSSAEFLVVISAVGVFALVGMPQADGSIRALITQERPTVLHMARHLLRRIPRAGSDGMALPPPEPMEAVEQHVDPHETAAETSRGRRLFPRR